MVDGAVSAAGAAARAARALALARSRSVLNAAEAAPSAELELALDCVQALVADEGVRWAADLQPADADEQFGDILRDAADVPHDEAADFASELRRACREVCAPPHVRVCMRPRWLSSGAGAVVASGGVPRQRTRKRALANVAPHPHARWIRSRASTRLLKQSETPSLRAAARCASA